MKREDGNADEEANGSSASKGALAAVLNDHAGEAPIQRRGHDACSTALGHAHSATPGTSLSSAARLGASSSLATLLSDASVPQAPRPCASNGMLEAQVDGSETQQQQRALGALETLAAHAVAAGLHRSPQRHA